MVSELYCDGLGACIGECPVNAITHEEREAEPYNEVAVMERISVKGNAVIVAHLNHLKDHGEKKLLQEGVAWLREKAIDIDLSSLHKQKKLGCGCSDSHERTWDEPASVRAGLSQPPIYEAYHVPESSGLQNVRPAFASKAGPAATTPAADQPSELRQFPVQLHLLNPQAPYFEGANVLLAADCTAFSLGNFHSQFLKGKKLAIACPKLDSDTGHYVDKLESMIDDSNIDMLTVLIMEVPCCNGLVGIAKKARDKASRNIPIKVIVVSVKGETLSQEWI